MTVVDHVHHDEALAWFEQGSPGLATLPDHRGDAAPVLLRERWNAVDSMAVLDTIRAQPWHTFWPTDLPYEAGQLVGVIGHRQVTDAYLVALARHHGGRLATFDRGQAVLHAEDVHLLTQ